MDVFMKQPQILIAGILLLASCAAPKPVSTPTPVPPSETPAATIVPSPTSIPPTPTPQTEFQVLDYSDCFAPNSGEGFETYIENDAFHDVMSVGAFTPCEGREFDDFSFEADILLLEGSTAKGQYSLIFRFNHQNYETFQFYEFTVLGDRAAISYVDTRAEPYLVPLVDWVEFPDLEVGKPAHLKVVAEGDRIAGFINNFLVGFVQDPNLTSGLVGIALYNNDSPSIKQHAVFENMTVRIFSP